VLTFQGVEVQWSPEFQDLDTRYAPATPWEKRCYFLNTNSCACARCRATT
jgi:hypothetical protein